eukprot:Awhi_evm1s882
MVMNNATKAQALQLLLSQANNNRIILDPQISIALRSTCRFLYFSRETHRTWTRLLKHYVLPFANGLKLEDLLKGLHDHNNDKHLDNLRKRIMCLLNLKCCFCFELTRYWFVLMNKRICMECFMHEDGRAALCSRNYAKLTFLITDNALQSLPNIFVPGWSVGLTNTRVQMFLIRDAKRLSLERWGSFEKMKEEKNKRNQKAKYKYYNTLPNIPFEKQKKGYLFAGPKGKGGIGSEMFGVYSILPSYIPIHTYDFYDCSNTVKSGDCEVTNETISGISDPISTSSSNMIQGRYNNTATLSRKSNGTTSKSNQSCVIVHTFEELKREIFSQIHFLNQPQSDQICKKFINAIDGRVKVIKVDAEKILLKNSLELYLGCCYIVGQKQKDGRNPILEIDEPDHGENEPLAVCTDYCQLNFDSFTMQGVSFSAFKDDPFMAGLQYEPNSEGIIKNCSLSCSGATVLCKPHSKVFIENCYFGPNIENFIFQKIYEEERSFCLSEFYDYQELWLYSDVLCSISLLDPDIELTLQNNAFVPDEVVNSIYVYNSSKLDDTRKKRMEQEFIKNGNQIIGRGPIFKYD